MIFLVKVRVTLSMLRQFAAALQKGALDNTRVRGTWCIKADPAVGYSVWETADRADFEKRFNPWREFYDRVEVTEVTTPKEAMRELFETPEAKSKVSVKKPRW
jgi:hypothetical protein